MLDGNLRETSLCQQTAALLWKNVLVKWRRKWHSALEWLQDLAFVFLVFIVTTIEYEPGHVKDSPALMLGRLDEFNKTNFTVGYVPTTHTAFYIMQKVANGNIIPDLNVREYATEEALLGDIKKRNLTAGVVFTDNFTYHIRYSIRDITDPNDYIAYMGYCEDSEYCYPTHYWSEGFLSLQASIDSAIIELTTNHSIWEDMASLVTMRMKTVLFFHRHHVRTATLLITLGISYISLTFLLSLYVTRERNEIREIMKLMRLSDLAFWLSWGLLYAGYALILAMLIALVITYSVLLESSYAVIMLLIFLYGISSISVTFMLSALFRNPRVTAIAGFFITLFLSALSVLLFMKGLPISVEVLLSIFPPFAFSVGLLQALQLENNGEGVYFSDMMGDSFLVLTSCITLIVDAIFYMAMALYFDKVLADKNGMKYEPFFFLKSSYWARDNMVPTGVKPEGSSEPAAGDFVEKVPGEFYGKEAIRINKVKKTYNNGDKKVAALRGLVLDVYEGQITALLGHSGAGKSTLLNILSGMCPASDGSATIYNYKLSDMRHLDEIKKRAGFCPQFDVKFDPLTVKENLKVFAKIKGIPTKQVEQEVQKVLSVLQMNDIENIKADKLSGGQKRKLTLGIAILGDPQVLFLDEPTAGLDPCSRHHVWAMLKERKANRVTLFSTQFMDEADILADRKAVISNGRLKCVGTSMFLKRKWGIGYHLRMRVSGSCDTELMTSLIRQHISSGKLSAQTEEELTYTLPFENMDAFPDLFSHLDGRVGQDIVNYGVSMTTLDDVFLQLEGEAEIDQGDYGVFSREQGGQEEREQYFPGEMDESLLLMSDSGQVTVSGFALWRQQVLALAKIRFLKLKHDTKSFRAILLLLVLFIIPLILIIVTRKFSHQIVSWELSSNLYFHRPGERLHRHYTSLLLVNNNTGSPIEDLLSALRTQEISVEVADGMVNTSNALHKGAIEVSREGKSYRFTILGNTKAQNGLPVLLNIISNALLRVFNSTEHIRVWNSPVLSDLSKDSHYIFFAVSLLFMAFASGLPAHFAMSSIEDNKMKARSQLRISGLFSSAYWLGHALVDVTLYWILLFLMTSILFALNYNIIVDFWTVVLLIVCIIGNGAALVLCVYIISFIFGRGKSHHDSWSFFFVMTAFVPLILNDIFAAQEVVFIIYLAILPTCSLLGFLLHLQNNFPDDEPVEHGYSSLRFACTLIPYLQIAVFLLILWALEWKFGRRSVKRDPVFRTSARKVQIKQNPEELGGEDEEVEAERERVRKFVTNESLEEKPVIIVDSLRKEYKVKKGGSIFKKKKKAATRNISFCVKKGEVLGLLGPNGAGKTTSIYMLAGEVKASAGEVLICGGGTDDTTGSMGYCPQDSPLWPNLTVKEHLEIYAAVKGMKREDADIAIKRVGEALELKDHLEKPARKLSAGVSRKVCFAISMLGNPTIVLLDEPSTGMDPKGQQRLWRAIRAAFKNKERGAILTTHYMEEAEAVCDRVAIMVSGKLRCIGSIQQLKSKFGKGYQLEIKLKDSHQADQIHSEIVRLFPHAERQERFPSFLVYKIPMDNVQSLSQAFFHLEEAKRAFNIEEYSFSQSTLEQVFIDLTKEQEKDDFDLDTKFSYKHLQTKNM